MRSHWMQAALIALALVVTSLCGTGQVQAQVLVSAEQNLQFGLLTPGAPMTVAPSDVVRRGAFEITGRGTFSISFQLPASMRNNTTGHTIPLFFGALDGQVDIRHKITPFDPAAGVSIRINPADVGASIYLGGRAQPASGTAAGHYAAEIVMLVVQTGT